MPLIFGETASGILVPLLLESDGSLPIAQYGWIGAAWQKNPLALGYSGLAPVKVDDNDADAGANTISTGNVPAGEIWIVEAISGRDNNSATTDVIIYVTTNAVNTILIDRQTLAAGEWITWSGTVTLNPGGSISVKFFDCSAGDDLTLRCAIRRVDIDQ